MGYMGLDSVGQSDEASDFVYDIFKAMEKRIRKELKNKSNQFNTPGWVNIALFVEEFLLPQAENFIYKNKFNKNIVKAQELLEKQLKDMLDGDDWGGKDMHVTAYRRMIRNLKKFLKKAEVEYE